MLCLSTVNLILTPKYIVAYKYKAKDIVELWLLILIDLILLSFLVI